VTEIPGSEGKTSEKRMYASKSTLGRKGWQRSFPSPSPDDARIVPLGRQQARGHTE